MERVRHYKERRRREGEEQVKNKIKTINKEQGLEPAKKKTVWSKYATKHNQL